MSNCHFKPAGRGLKWYAVQDAIDFPHTIERSRLHYELLPDVPGSCGRLCSDPACAYCVFMRAREQTQ